jgi:multicomponent Na+:H+ antiporter subunit E
MIKKMVNIIKLLLLYVRYVLFSNLKVAYHLLFRMARFQPGLLEYEVSDLNRYQAFTLFNIISMTPGTLSVDWLKNENKILVHTLYGRETYSIIKDISLLERIIKKSF